MSEPADKSLSLREDLKSIARDLNVPKKRCTGFVEKTLALSDFVSRCGGLDRYLPALRQATSIEPLKKANNGLKDAIEILQDHWLPLNRVISIELRRELAQLLDHSDAKSLFTTGRFVCYDELARHPRPATTHPLIADTPNESDSQVTFASDPATSLVALLNFLQERLETDLEEHKANVGGKPPRWLRKHLLKELLVLYEATFCEEAKSTPGGKFSTMCTHLFMSFDISIVGLDEAISRFLKEQRSKS
ncbi:hypothetical protein Q4578_15215 [Shimia thalassica]|uniref:hypothetical protein n=1 Tax=Shimia thalassica TaxID=1715693 RepID=UPI0026E2C4B5|nr:hypothetical protein [Shimia thalassica]MDO6522947.1 hypothetical protein [Shimia thalassica]